MDSKNNFKVIGLVHCMQHFRDYDFRNLDVSEADQSPSVAGVFIAIRGKKITRDNLFIARDKVIAFKNRKSLGRRWLGLQPGCIEPPMLKDLNLI